MKDIEQLLQELTIHEKAALLEGYQSWMTNAIPRKDVPAIYLTDGPVGVRKKKDTEEAEGIGLGESYPATAFPAGVSAACSWNPDLAEAMGTAIGEECAAMDVQVLLAPAMNLKRDPRCGRNFEYYSEDPLLTGKMAAAFTRGVQSTGTAACPKHFALNNSENYRYMGDSVADERAVRELYLKAFEICVKEAQPRTMMCAYNKVNGTHCSENEWLLTDVLRKEWGYKGLVMTDWGATRCRLDGVKAGLDLDMPGGIWENRKSIIDAAKSGELTALELDRAVGNVLKLIEDSLKVNRPSAGIRKLLPEHHKLAGEMAQECAVLLKNDGALPLKKKTKVLAVGGLFRKMRYQGAGSSGVKPAYLVTPEDAFSSARIRYTFAPGYNIMQNKPDAALEAEALTAAESADVVLFFGGLTELYESEGYDRDDLSIPENQIHLIDRLCETGKKVVAVLFGGSAMELPFAEKCAAILYMGLPGQYGGEVCRRLLYGEANPCGHLGETWMRSVNDIPFGENYGKRKIELYRENLYVGYRYYDQVPEKILYPFGHGLSYTEFVCRDLKLSQADGEVRAALTIENTGELAGAQVLQLYVKNNTDSRVFKAEKELRAFEKVFLEPGESRDVILSFAESDLAYYNTREHGWVLENGKYQVQIGFSSREILLSEDLELSGYPETEGQYSAETVAAYRAIASQGIADAVFEETIGRAIPQEPPVRPYTVESPIEDYKNSFFGKRIYKSFMDSISLNTKKVDKVLDGPDKDEFLMNHHFLEVLIPHNSIRSLIQSSGGMMQMSSGYATVEFANGHVAKAMQMTKEVEMIARLPCQPKMTEAEREAANAPQDMWSMLTRRRH